MEIYIFFKHIPEFLKNKASNNDCSSLKQICVKFGCSLYINDFYFLEHIFECFICVHYLINKDRKTFLIKNIILKYMYLLKYISKLGGTYSFQHVRNKNKMKNC